MGLATILQSLPVCLVKSDKIAAHKMKYISKQSVAVARYIHMPTITVICRFVEFLVKDGGFTELHMDKKKIKSCLNFNQKKKLSKHISVLHT